MSPGMLAERIQCRKVFRTLPIHDGVTGKVRPMRIRGFTPATPCWVELVSVDPARAAEF
jgi:hypothetical protein